MTAGALARPQAGARPADAAPRGAGWAALRPQLPQPDFLQPVARPGALAWAWLATGLLVLGAAGLEAREAWLDRTQALVRLDDAGRRAARAAAPVVPTTARPGPAADRAAEAQRWLQRLARPWPAVWAAAEIATPPAESLRWLGMELTESSMLRLSGQADDAATAQAAAQALRQQQHQGAALWHDVVLASIERLPEGQRFEIVARLATAAGTGPETPRVAPRAGAGR